MPTMQSKAIPTDAIAAMQAYNVEPADLTSQKVFGKSQVNLIGAMNAPRRVDKIAIAYRPWEAKQGIKYPLDHRKVGKHYASVQEIPAAADKSTGDLTMVAEIAPKPNQPKKWVR